jgi:23S rRNA pseudouridine955/2504/2580 synthase
VSKKTNSTSRSSAKSSSRSKNKPRVGAGVIAKNAPKRSSRGKSERGKSELRAPLSRKTGPNSASRTKLNHTVAAIKRPESAFSKQSDSQSVVTNIPNKVSFVTIDENHASQRLDNFLITYLKGVPKTHIYRIIRKGEVRINKGRVKQTTRLSEGDSVRIPPIRLTDRSTDNLDGNKYSFLGKAVLFEDDALLIINKPCGMAVHAGSGITVGVIEAMRAYRSDLKYIELVHRLDRETSGVLVLAKKATALKILHDDFKTNSLKNPRLDKRYLTLVKGQWQHGQRRVSKALNTDARRHGERFVVVDSNGSYASSIMTPKAISPLASLIEVKLLTGRTHQVRVHALSENHPVAGDQKYGELEFNKSMKSAGLSRLFLHAAKLTFYHPLTKESTTVEAPLPDELALVLDKLELKIS